MTLANERVRNRKHKACSIVLALMGVASAFYASRWGVGLIADSKYYLGAARSLLEGHGLVVPTISGKMQAVTNWPPLFSILLAGFGFFGVDLQVGARWLNISLFGITILLGMQAIRYVTDNSIRLVLLGGFLMATSVDLLYVFTLAGTEPLFIFFGLLGLFLIGAHLEHPEPRRLLGASAAIAIAFLSRFAGAFLVVTGVLSIVLFDRRYWLERIKDASVLGVASSLPMLLWMLRNWFSASQPIGSFRVPEVHLINRTQMSLGLQTMWGWVSPARDLGGGFASLTGHIPRVLGVLFLVALVAVFVIWWRWGWGWEDRTAGETKGKPSLTPPLLSVLLAFIVLYMGFLVFSISFLDRTIPLDQRLLSPIFPAALIFIIGTCHRLFRVFHVSQVIRWSAMLGCLLLVVVYADAAARWVRQGHENGLGYARRVWRESDILQKVAALPQGVPIYTNGDDVVTLVTGRPADELPPKVFLNTGQNNSGYSTEIAVMGEQLRKGAVVVYLNRITWRRHYPSEAELKEQLPLRLREGGTDGSIYDIAP